MRSQLLSFMNTCDRERDIGLGKKCDSDLTRSFETTSKSSFSLKGCPVTFFATSKGNHHHNFWPTISRINEHTYIKSVSWDCFRIVNCFLLISEAMYPPPPREQATDPYFSTRSFAGWRRRKELTGTAPPRLISLKIYKLNHKTSSFCLLSSA